MEKGLVKVWKVSSINNAM